MAKQKNIKVLFVDVDDTILDTAALRAKAFAEAVRNNLEFYQGRGINTDLFIKHLLNIGETKKGSFEKDYFNYKANSKMDSIPAILLNPEVSTLALADLDMVSRHGQYAPKSKKISNTDSKFSNEILETLKNDAKECQKSWLEEIKDKGRMPQDSMGNDVYRFLPGAQELLESWEKSGFVGMAKYDATLELKPEQEAVLFWSYGNHAEQGLILSALAHNTGNKDLARWIDKAPVVGAHYDDEGNILHASQEKPSIAKMEEVLARANLELDNVSKITFVDDSVRTIESVFQLKKMGVDSKIIIIPSTNNYSKASRDESDFGKLIKAEIVKAMKMTKLNDLQEDNLISLVLSALNNENITGEQSDIIRNYTAEAIESMHKMQKECKKTLIEPGRNNKPSMVESYKELFDESAEKDELAAQIMNQDIVCIPARFGLALAMELVDETELAGAIVADELVAE